MANEALSHRNDNPLEWKTGIASQYSSIKAELCFPSILELTNSQILPNLLPKVNQNKSKG